MVSYFKGQPVQGGVNFGFKVGSSPVAAPAVSHTVSSPVSNLFGLPFHARFQSLEFALDSYTVLKPASVNPVPREFSSCQVQSARVASLSAVDLVRAGSCKVSCLISDTWCHGRLHVPP